MFAPLSLGKVPTPGNDDSGAYDTTDRLRIVENLSDPSQVVEESHGP